MRAKELCKKSHTSLHGSISDVLTDPRSPSVAANSSSESDSASLSWSSSRFPSAKFSSEGRGGVVWIFWVCSVRAVCRLATESPKVYPILRVVAASAKYVKSGG